MTDQLPGRGESTDLGDHRDWFDTLYAEADAGRAEVPWDREGPNPLFRAWADEHGVRGDDRSERSERRRALVVGCGLGSDSEYAAALGFATVAFDFAPRSIEDVRRRHPDSTVDYHVADLLDPPAEWSGAFDLVIESLTVQSLPRGFRTDAIAHVRRFVAPGGTLLVISGMADYWEPGPDGPWPLTRAELDTFATPPLELVRLETPLGTDGTPRYRAELHRPIES